MGFFITEEMLFEPAARTPKTATSATAKDVSGHRLYQPESGRWVSRDPIKERITITRYDFCRNNPLSRVDAIGLWCIPFTTKRENETYTPPKTTVPWIFESIEFIDPIELHSEARATVGYGAYKCHYKRDLTKTYDKFKCCWFQWVPDGTGSATETERTATVTQAYPDVILIYGSNDRERYTERCRAEIPPS